MTSSFQPSTVCTQTNVSSPLPLTWGKEAPRRQISIVLQNATAASNPLRRCVATARRAAQPVRCLIAVAVPLACVAGAQCGSEPSSRQAFVSHARAERHHEPNSLDRCDRCTAWVTKPAIRFRLADHENFFHYLNDAVLPVMDALHDTALTPAHITRCANGYGLPDLSPPHPGSPRDQPPVIPFFSTHASHANQIKHAAVLVQTASQHVKPHGTALRAGPSQLRDGGALAPRRACCR